MLQLVYNTMYFWHIICWYYIKQFQTKLKKVNKMLTNKHLSGETPVVVINRKLNGENLVETENGKIIKVLQGDRQGVYAKVKIDGDIVERWIFASDQPDDINYRP